MRKFWHMRRLIILLLALGLCLPALAGSSTSAAKKSSAGTGGIWSLFGGGKHAKKSKASKKQHKAKKSKKSSKRHRAKPSH